MNPDVEQAIRTLVAAGWRVFESEGAGTLQAGILVSALGYHPDNRRYRHMTVQQPWAEVTD